ncbi:MAG: methyltransferase [Candidatus Methanomethylophilaceae archaeon]|nr:methyltransferase [Candidatus Methanomethylophilaceae archaeon]
MCPDYFFELSGELKDMCSAEAKKCIEAEAGQFEIKSEGPGYLIASFDERAVNPIADRISLTHKIGRHLCSFDPSDISSVDDIRLPDGSFAIRSRRFEGRMKDIDSQDLIRKVGSKLSKENPVRLKDPDLEIHMIMSDRVHLFLEVRDVDRNILETRKVGERPFFSPISLHPRYARAIINLTGAHRGDTILDPFCGTGGLAIEAGFMGMKPIISDFDENMIIGTQENMEYYGLELEDFATIDISDVPDTFGQVDAIATDPPYGRSTHTGGEPIDSIYRRAMDAFAEVLRPGGAAGVVLPHTIDSEGLALESHFVQRVHGSLSRHYHVFRKT